MDYELFIQRFQTSQNLLGALTYLFSRIKNIMKKHGQLEGIREFLLYGGMPTNQNSNDMYTFK